MSEIKNNDDFRLLVIVGKSCTGKSELEARLTKEHFHKCVSLTTRPKRNGEVDGVDYHYITNEEFEQLEKSNELFEKTEYLVDGEVWKYGLTSKSFSNEKPNIAVVNFEGLRQLLEREELKDKIFVLVMQSELDDIINRYLKREGVDIYSKEHSEHSSIVKDRLLQRLIQDHKDFERNGLEFFKKFKLDNPEKYSYYLNEGMDYTGIEVIEGFLLKAIGALKQEL